MSITVKDLAKICGVSRATVDRALHNKPQISEKTREKILDAAKQYGYQPDLLARGLSKGSTKRIGVVINEVRAPYFVQMLTAMEMRSREMGYSIHFTLQGNDSELEKSLIQEMVNYRVDGLLLSPVNKGADFENFLLDLPVPVVTVGCLVSNNIPLVGIQERCAGADVFNRLAAKGYQRIVFICPILKKENLNQNCYIHEQRLLGLKDAHQQREDVELIECYQEDYEEIIRQVQKMKPKRTVFFCSGDKPAADLQLVLRHENLSVPEDFGIIGFGGTELINYTFPRIETVSSGIEEVGRKSVDLLIRRIQGETVKPATYIRHSFISGASL